MNNNLTRTYWLHALSPLHIGVGRGEGFIDLPIIRERITGWPIAPGSSVKGVIADYFGADDAARKLADRKGKICAAAFGRAGADHANSGSIVFSDARIVSLPVRSLYGTFAWATSPMVLQRLLRDLKVAGQEGGLPAIPTPNEDKMLTPRNSELGYNDSAFLEDIDFDLIENDDVSTWADKLGDLVFGSGSPWLDEFKKRFAVISNNRFDFLCESATEVAPHIKIKKDTQTVQDGALWYEEALPAETILQGVVWCDRVFAGNGLIPGDLIKEFCGKELSLQMGGKATVGKGRVRCIFTGGNIAGGGADAAH